MDSNKPNKKTKGRQKIEIKKIEKKESRQVTFTKRRDGLIKKAAELCILTTAQVAVIVRSPGGRTKAFGHPDVGAVMERYLGGGGGDAESVVTEDFTRVFSGQYDDVAEELAKEKRRAKEIDAGSNMTNGGFWWEEPIDGLGLDELESYVAALEELRNTVSMRANEMMHINASNSMHYSSPILEMNQITSSENSNELAYNHFININQPQDSASINSLVNSGYDFGYGHAA